MSSKLWRRSLLMGLIVGLMSIGLQAQESDFEEIGGDEFSEFELDDTDFSDDDFDDVEFDDDEVADEEFDDSDIQDADELAEDEFQDESAEDELAEELQFDEEPVAEEELLIEEPVAEEPLEDIIDEPISEDLVAPEVAEEEDLFSTPNVPDEPNLEYEAKLHSIYNKFHKEKTSDEAWQGVAGERITEVYTIQKDDKLWEISRTLFGDGNYWPKIWSLNSRIRNPHLIRPKNQIQFVLGDESGPPAFSISEEMVEETTEEETSTVADATTRQQESNQEENEPEIPPPLINSRAVVKKLPPSLPKWQVLGEQGQFDELGIDYGVRKITKLENRIPLAAYVSEREPNPVGMISEVEAGSQIASTLQYVYVEIDSGAGQIGDTLLVIRNMGEVEKAHSSVTGFLGYSVEVQGEIQLVEKIPRKSVSQKKRRRRRGNGDSGGELYRAIVSRLVNPVNVGSIIVPGRIEYIKVSEKGPRSQVVAQIIGGQYFNKRQIYGAESVAYLNRGANDGLKVGDILSVRENRNIRNAETLVKTNVRPIGWVRVVKVEPSLSTVVVVNAWSDILTGDITGSGTFTDRAMKDLAAPKQEVDTASRTLLQELDEVPIPVNEKEEDITEDSDLSEDEFNEEEFEYEDFGDDEF